MSNCLVNLVFLLSAANSGQVVIEDHNALRDFVDERVRQRFEAIPGVSQVIVAGGAPRELTVAIDEGRCAALGVRWRLRRRWRPRRARPTRSR